MRSSPRPHRPKSPLSPTVRDNLAATAPPHRHRKRLCRYMKRLRRASWDIPLAWHGAMHIPCFWHDTMQFVRASIPCPTNAVRSCRLFPKRLLRRQPATHIFHFHAMGRILPTCRFSQPLRATILHERNCRFRSPCFRQRATYGRQAQSSRPPNELRRSDRVPLMSAKKPLPTNGPWQGPCLGP